MIERIVRDQKGDEHRAYVVKTKRGTELLIDAGIADVHGKNFIESEIKIAEEQGL
jgi:hypothetical protein